MFSFIIVPGEYIHFINVLIHVGTYFIALSYLLLLESGKLAVMYLCVRGNDLASFICSILIFECGIVPDVWTVYIMGKFIIYLALL